MRGKRGGEEGRREERREGRGGGKRGGRGEKVGEKIINNVYMCKTRFLVLVLDSDSEWASERQ